MNIHCPFFPIGIAHQEISALNASYWKKLLPQTKKECRISTLSLEARKICTR